MTNETMLPRNEEPKGTERAADKAPARYEAPRIVTHSAEKLQNAAQPVNACTSFTPP